MMDHVLHLNATVNKLIWSQRNLDYWFMSDSYQEKVEKKAEIIIYW